MKSLFLIVFSFVLVAGVSAQEKPLGSLRAILAGPGERVSESGKCGTPLVFEALRRLKDFPAPVKDHIGEILQRPSTQASRLSPSGRFRVHYDTSGAQQPSVLAGSPLSPVPQSYEEYVDSVAAAADLSWDVEVTSLGFQAPPGDGIAGGGPEYDIYVQSLASTDFGFTSWDGEQQLESGDHARFNTFMTIDNDFFAQRTKGWDGLHVTIAHELNHAIQIGSYGMWTTVPNSDFAFFEMTSVWFEDVVFDDVNDYYFDLPHFLQTFTDGAGHSFSLSSYTLSEPGYERAIWIHYLDQRLGRSVVREIWEGAKGQPLLRSMEHVLLQHNASLPAAVAEFGFWNLFTAQRSLPGKYYREAAGYPPLLPNFSTSFNGSLSFFQSAAFPLSLQYYEFVIPGDTVFACLANVDAVNAYEAPTMLRSLRVSLSESKPAGGTQQLSGGLFAGIVVNPAEDWRVVYMRMSSARDSKVSLTPFPNPIVLQKAAFLTLPVEGTPGEIAETFILTSSFDLVFSGSYPMIDSFGLTVLRIPTRDLAAHVSSGVYFVVVKYKDGEQQWKVVMIR